MTEHTTPLPGGISCDVCRDLAPLVADGVASADSAALVREHLARCESCRAEFSQLCPEGAENQPAPALPVPDESRVLRRVQNKLTLWLLGFLVLGLGGSMLVVFSPHSTLALLCFPLVCGVVCWFDDFLWRLVPVLAAVIWFVWTLAAELPYYTNWQGAVIGCAVGALWPFVFCVIGALAASLFKYAFGKTGKEK